MQRSDILLVVCSAKSATGSLTLEEKTVLKEWQAKWQERWKAKPSGQVLVVCNKMNAIDVSTTPIPRDEALQLIVDNSRRFQSERMQTKSNAEKLEEAAADFEDATDAEVDDEARPHKKPDEGPVRQLVLKDASEVFDADVIQQGGVHFVSANEALTRSRAGAAQPDEFQALRRCLLDRIEKAGPEKASRLEAAARREQERRALEQQRLAAAKAESKEAERRERALQAEADQKRRQAEQDERRQRDQRLAAERAAYEERMSKMRDETWAKSVGAGAVSTVGVSAAAVAVPTGGAVAVTGLAAQGVAAIGLSGGAAAGAVAAAPVVAAGSVAAGVGLGLAIVAKQALFNGGQDVRLDPYLGVGGAPRCDDELRRLGITELQLGSNFLAYTIKFKALERGNWAFEDENGAVYKVSCLLKGTHRLSYNSKRPRITKVTRF